MADDNTFELDIGIGDSLDDINELLSALKELDETTKELSDGLSGGLFDGVEEIDALTKEVEEFKNSLGDVSDIAKGSFDKLKAPITDVTKKAKDLNVTVSKGMEKSKLASMSFGKIIKTGISNEFDNVKKKVSGVAKSISSGFKKAGDVIKHPIKNLKQLAANYVVTRKEAKEAAKEAKRAAKEAAKAEKENMSFTDKAVARFEKMAAVAGGVVAGIQMISGAMNFATAAVQASETAERVEKSFKNSFGESTKEVDNWADNFSTAINRNKTEVKGFLTSSNEMLKNLGIDDEAALQMSEVTTSISYDLARDFKVDDTEMFDAVKDAVSGNVEALSQYGVTLDDAMLQQTAYDMGLGEITDDMEESTLAQIRLNSIIEQTGDSHEMASKSLGGLQGGIKAVQSAFTGFMEKAGDKLAPVFDKIFGVILEFLPQVESMILPFMDMLSESVVKLLPSLMELAEKLFPVLFDVLNQLVPVLLDLGAQLLPVIADVLIIVLDAVVPLIPPLMEILMKILKPLLPVFVQLVDALLPPLVSLLDAILPVIEPLIPVFEFFAEVLSVVVGWIGELVSGVSNLLSSGLGKLGDFVGGLFGGGDKKSDPLPKNASGTDNFSGGWTEINEIGGEIVSATGNDVAYLPKGSTIIPADKSQDIIEKLTGHIEMPENVALYLAPPEILYQESERYKKSNDLEVNSSKNNSETEQSNNSGSNSEKVKKVYEIYVSLKADKNNTDPEFINILLQLIEDSQLRYRLKEIIKETIGEVDDENVKKATIQEIYT